MHALISFYLGRSPDHAGRMIDDIWAFSINQLECQHDFIQWLFPNERPSLVNPDAPVFDAPTAAEFRANTTLQSRLRRSFEILLRFYGLEPQVASGRFRVLRAPCFHHRADDWLTPNNHNHLRITRILKCLSLCGMEVEARAFLDQLLELAASYPRAISPQTLAYWRAAV